MTYSYCTLFDSLYLSKALAMYDSLRKNCPDFHLYIFPFDERSKEILEQLRLTNVTIVPLAQFENPELLAVKKTRTKGEYCWTCTPAIIYYCIERYRLVQCTYIDADLYFYSNPNVLIDEMGSNSVLITEHRYTKRYDHAAKRGIYCVQFITFRNDEAGMIVLNWWKARCLEWCYARMENGKFGDQKYLDDWTERFKGVHVLEHLGGGVAPWNIQQYTIERNGAKLRLKSHALSFDFVFYHFHYVRFYDADRVDLGNFLLSKWIIATVYKPYIREVIEVESMLKDRFQFEKQHQIYFYKNWALTPIHKLGRKLLGIYNVYKIRDIENGTAD